jgi:hypothetical protein
LFSVLIQNQKTMESFQQYHPLFVEALNREEIGVCQWFEAGLRIETAVPELNDLIADKEEWRAIVVRFADDTPMAAYETDPDNPYDFLVNREDDPRMRESEIPLIRLTHMLGGLPSPNVRFEAKVVKEPNKAPRMVYIPSVSREDEEAYRRLSEKYRLDGPPPSEILLISLRVPQDKRVENVTQVWDLIAETNSSTFWRRNGYPSPCRFLVCDMEQHGPVQNTADMFSAWMTVLLLALNDIDPSTLQAYKLHRADVELDRSAMESTIQGTAGRILSAKVLIQKSLQRELEQRISEKTPLPDFMMETPVILELPMRKEFLASGKSFGLTSGTASSDWENWLKMEQTTEAVLDEAEVTAERALDRTAFRMKEFIPYQQEEILPLDPYQWEDMNKALSALNRDIYARRAALPVGCGEDRERLKGLASSVRDKLLRRPTRREVRNVVLVALACFLLAVLPGLLYYYTRERGEWFGLLIGILGGAAVLLLAMLIRLVMLRRRLRTDIAAFNRAAESTMDKISSDSEQYSRYLGSVASFMHGQSYLTGLRQKAFRQDEAIFYKRNHIAAINSFLADLKSWSTAFHLPIHFDTADFQEYLSIDTDVAPNVNPLYTFDPIGSYTVQVNNAGSTINAPFNFIKKLSIEREELYDDER